VTGYLLDTDISSYIIRRRPATVRERFGRIGSDRLAISVVTEAELRYGAARYRARPGILADVEDFVDRLIVREWDRAAAMHYADIRAHVERAGKPVGNMDLMIAAHARSLAAVLVTNNQRHFRHVPGLVVENWA
jgi:tRNA(fMet)-specific endonuclease VapC